MKFRRFPKELSWCSCNERFYSCFDYVINSSPVDILARYLNNLLSVIHCATMCIVCSPFVIIMFTCKIIRAYLLLLQWCLHLNSQETEEKIQAYIKRKTTENT